MESCSRNFVRVVAVLLLIVWTICTMSCGQILGSMGFDASFPEDYTLSFKEKLINCIKYFTTSLTISAFAESGVVWSILFIFSKLEPIIRKFISRKLAKHTPLEVSSDLASISLGKKCNGSDNISQKKDTQPVLVQSPCAGVFVAIFFATFAGSVSVACSVLAVRLKSDHIENVLIRYVISDVSAGLLFPLLYLVAIVAMTAVVDHCTCHALEFYTLLAMMLPGVTFKEVDRNGGYWIFSDSLIIGQHYDLNPKKKEFGIDVSERQRDQIVKNKSPAYSSVFLVLLFVFNMTLSFSYFVDISFIFQTTVKDVCDDLKYMWYSCFDSETFQSVNCFSHHLTNFTLYCYRFNMNFQNANISLAILSSCGLHIGLLCILIDFIYVVGRLQKVFRYLGTIVAILGISLLYVTISMFLLRQMCTSDLAKFLNSYFNVLHFVQLLILSMDVLIIGMLVRQGKPMRSDTEEKVYRVIGGRETLV